MYLVNYIINEKSSSFYKEILKNLGLKEFAHVKEFEKEIIKENFLEVNLFNEDVSIDLNCALSILEINIKYGQFIMSEDVEERVKVFENQLLKIITNNSFIYRVDESMVENYWVSINDEFWYEKSNAFNKFSSWIIKQEKLHWEKIDINTEVIIES